MEEGSNRRDDALAGRMKLIASKVDSKIYFHHDAMLEYRNMKHIISDLTEEKARMDEEAHRRLAAVPPELLALLRKELAATREQLGAANEELAATREQLGAANEELATTREQLRAAIEEVVATKEQLEAAKEQLIEAVRHQDKQQRALDSVECQPSMRRTGSTAEREMGVVGGNALKAQHFGQQIPGHCDELDVLRGVLIKEFMQDSGGHILGVKEMGRLKRKPFDEACAAKLPPKEAKKTASKLYTTWENLLKNPSWKPFKTVVAGDDHHRSVLLNEDIDVDDDKLQELRRTWGEGACCGLGVGRDE
ncbi:hypothetical protein PR202_gb24012 [Eleusine coracana subsp. coracana]|uniref:Factor of DNA methylation 1-5/IDN2 domain-containing protein n=1 Tax=Eleusine coracana subsp. coracana TaxID=191504 RepID=A0AAV5FLC1_ELECO|nr:hypothetical protein QOZ80_5BG0443120 [Eleusine coracana subsp. coracana]GJN35260.1 hypothetical protein PR202_gb24012 [Eleusine coracana subsp. coracana]